MKRFKFAVNTHGKNKDWDFRALAGKFRDVSGTVEDVQRHVAAGHALCAGLLGRQWRAKRNVIGSQWILLDIDNSDVVRDEDGKPVKDEAGKTTPIYKHQLSLDEALAHPFIQQHCALIYTTASHRPEWPKFRLVFLLPSYVADIDTYEAMVRLLMEQLPHDPSCKDASRVFYGSTEASFPLVNPDAALPLDWQQKAIAAAEQAKQEYEARIRLIEARRRQREQVAAAEGWDTDELIQQALAVIPPRTPGSGNYDECRQVLMALVDHYGASEAEDIAERWSPSIKGTTWDIRQKIKSFRRGGITIGTLFHIAKGYGFRFPEAQSHTSKAGPDSKEYAAYLAWEQEQDAIATAQTLEEIAPALTQGILSQAERETAHPESVELAEESADIYRYSIGSRLGAWKQLQQQGKRVIIDLSGTGGGKSFDAARTSPEYWGCDRVIAGLPDAQNPTVKGFEDWALLEGRHLGNVEENGKLRRATIDTPKDAKVSPANCDKAYALQVLAERNPATPAFFLGCQNCVHNWRCGKESGDGFGARFQAAEAWGSKFIRTSYARLPHGDGDEAGNLATAALILDEASGNLQTVKTVEVTRDDQAAKWAQVSFESEVLTQQLRNLFQWLQDGRYREISSFNGRYGIVQADVGPELRKLLPEHLDWAEIASLEDDTAERQLFGLNRPKMTQQERSRLKKLEAKRPLSKSESKRLAELVERQQAGQGGSVFDGRRGAGTNRQQFGLAGLTKEERKDLKQLQQKPLTEAEAAELAALRAKHEVSKGEPLSPGEMAARAKELPKRWLTEFLQVLLGDIPGHITILPDGTISLVIENRHHRSAIAAAKQVLILDKSFPRDRETAALMLGCSPDEIAYCEVEAPSYGNVTTIQVTGLGKLGSNRGEQLEKCRQKLVEALKRQDPTHVHFDRKAFSPDGVLFRDNVGSNDYQGCKSISSTIPRPNMAAMLAQYCTLTGQAVGFDSEGFQHYYRRTIRELLDQTKGRLRANLRPGESLEFYVLGDDDLPIGCDRIIEALDITPEAARKGKRGILQILEAAQWVLTQGQNLTQTAVAAATRALGLRDGKGFSQQYISKVWQAVLERLQLFLLGVTKKSCSQVDEPTVSDAVEVIEAVAAAPDPPVEAVTEVVMGLSQADAIATWRRLSYSAQKLVIQSLMLALAPGRVESLMEAVL